MPYSFPNNVPRPAKNWTEAEQKKCIAAANAVLGDKGTEQQAIFACIRAAGKTEHPGGKKSMFEGIVASLKELIFGKDEEADVEAGQVKARKLLEGQKSSLAVYKQADGKHRWVGVVSNHFRDNDTPREIISSAAHKEYVEYADKSGKYPELWLWHVPGSKVGQADILDFTTDGFLVASGLFDSEEVAEKLSEEKDLTMSHGFVRLKAMSAEGITDYYRMVEASPVPAGAECNPWTRFTTYKEDKEMLSETKKAFLSKFLPEDQIKALENDMESMRKAAEEAGVDWKAVETLEAEPTEATTEPHAEGDAAKFSAEDYERIGDVVYDRIAEKFQLGNLSQVLVGLNERLGKFEESAQATVKAIEVVQKEISELKQSDDEKVAKVLTPKAADAFMWMNMAASKREDTKLTDNEKDKKLLDQKPLWERIAESAAESLPKNIGG